MNGPPHRLAVKRVWMLPVLVAAVLSGAIILLMIKHVGLLGPLYARFRQRRSGHRP